MVDPSPSPDLSSVDFAAQFDNLPMDSLFFADNNDALSSEEFTSDLDLGLDLDGDFEFTFDDLDNLRFPFNVDEFLFDDAPVIPPVQIHDDRHGVADCECNPSDIARFSNSQFYPPASSDNLGDRNSHGSNDVKVSKFQSLVSDSCDRESSGEPVSSEVSGNGRSGFCDVTDSPSPHSTRYNRDFTSQVIVDENKKLEEIGKGCDLKRKIENNEENNESRTMKHRRSSTPMENTTQEPGVSTVDEDDKKTKARLMRNRESAQLSRLRKKQYVEELEEKVKSMHSTITDLSSKISFVMAENATLRQRLSAGGMCPAPPAAPGVYTHPPMPPIPYSWVPYAPYVVNPQGSQVPLVPIPRLKSQQSAASSKSKQSERKKSEGKTKKVASISLLGLLFFVLLFGGLVPLVNIKFDGLADDVSGRSRYVSDRFYGQLGGKVWPVNGPRNGSEGYKDAGSSSGRFGIFDRMTDERGWNLAEEMNNQQDSPRRSGSDEFVQSGNTSEPLVASLYVPRNDKLVKIDGNLIINSVLASQKAMASQTAHVAKNDKIDTRLAISKYWDSALAIPEVDINRSPHPHLHRSPPEKRKALPYRSAEISKGHLESSSSDGKIQQWFWEGLAGPMLSSGMCTEVFQFDVSPRQGAIVPASSAANVSEENHQNATRLNMSRNRRILHRFPLAGSRSNVSEGGGGKNSLNDNFHCNKSKSSMVVSVLVDPKEAGDVDGIITPKSLSRIFVVVLVDSIKYVTYSCVVPRASPHRVTA